MGLQFYGYLVLLKYYAFSYFVFSTPYLVVNE